MVVNVYIEAMPAESFPVRILLTPVDAAALAQALAIAYTAPPAISLSMRWLPKDAACVGSIFS